MNGKIFFSAFVIFFETFFKLAGVDFTLLGRISNALLILFVCLNFSIYKNIFTGEYKKINLLTVIWLLIILYSGYVNQHLFYDSVSWNGELLDSMHSMRFEHVVLYVLNFFSSILYYQYLKRCNKCAVFLKYFMAIMFAYAAISNINVLIISDSNYLVGNKFYVCYLNLYAITLYCFYYPVFDKKKVFLFRTFILISILIAVKTECTTAILGSLLMYCFFLKLRYKFMLRLYDWKTFLYGLIFFDVIFFFFTMTFLDNPIMRFIIVDVFGEDMTLTGRLDIYAAVGGLLAECPLWGFGVNNAHMMTVMYGVGSNAQNGILNYMLEVGILGVVASFLLLFEMLKKSKENYGAYAMICFTYIMLVLSSIEITFTTYFFAMSFLLLLNNETVEDSEIMDIKYQMQ